MCQIKRKRLGVPDVVDKPGLETEFLREVNGVEGLWVFCTLLFVHKHALYGQLTVVTALAHAAEAKLHGKTGRVLCQTSYNRGISESISFYTNFIDGRTLCRILS